MGRARKNWPEDRAVVAATPRKPAALITRLPAEPAVSAWGYSLVVFNSDENPEAEKQILYRVRTLRCEGLVLVPVSGALSPALREFDGRRLPTVLFGRTVDDDRLDTVTIDNFSASYQVTKYLIDLGHTRIGAIAGPVHVSTGKDRFEGM